MDEVPPQFTALADQGYAQACERLNGLVSQLAANMRSRPEQGDAVPWAASVVMMMQSLNQAALEAAAHPELSGSMVSPALVEVWQAAIYQLARQQVAQGS